MKTSQSWIEKLSELREAGRTCAMVVVTEVRGSGPREAGARMIVSGSELVWGTIGGGNLELQAIQHCDELLSRGGGPLSDSVDYPLSEKVGQCCGGQVTLFYETFAWKRRQVVIFGAGHVGQALAGLSGYLSADVLVIDGRTEQEIKPNLSPQRDYELQCIDAPEAEIDRIPEDSYVLIMTHSHALDLEVLMRALKRGGFPYLGLIGSQRKWQRFEKRLLQRGIEQAAIDTVRCPIGVSKISKEPTAIAITTAAELLEVMGATATTY